MIGAREAEPRCQKLPHLLESLRASAPIPTYEEPGQKMNLDIPFLDERMEMTHRASRAQ